MAKKKTAKIPAKKASQSSQSEFSKPDASHKEQRKASRGKRVKQGDWEDELQQQLRPLGLRVKEMSPDGNCFFRSLGDQLQGSDEAHVDLRKRVLDHIEANPDDFQPFIEDDEPFPDYIRRMRKDGTWAGNIEIVASSQLLRVNFRIFQPEQPIWAVGEFPPETSQTLHLSYHGGQHYNSVRAAEDFGDGPPAPIRLAVKSVAEGNGSAGELPAGEAKKKKKGAKGSAGAPEDSREEFRKAESVMEESGCYDLERVRRALEACGGDAEEAVLALIEDFAGSSMADPSPAPAAEPQPLGETSGGDPSLDCQPGPVSPSLSSSKPKDPSPNPVSPPPDIPQPRPPDPTSASDPPVALPPSGTSEAATPLATTLLEPAPLAGLKGATESQEAPREAAEDGTEEGRNPGGAKKGPGVRAGGPKEDPGGRGKKRPKQAQGKGKDERKQPRNQKCACGSKKKTKNCCGAAGAGLRTGGASVAGEVDPGVMRLEILSI